MLEVKIEGEKRFLKINGTVVSETTSRLDGPQTVFRLKHTNATTLVYGCSFGEIPPDTWIVLRLFRLGIITCKVVMSSTLIDMSAYVAGVMEWRRPYSVVDFMTQLRLVIAERYPAVIVGNGPTESELSLTYKIQYSEMQIRGEVREIIDCLTDLVAFATATCSEQSRGRSLATYFLFPEEVKSACEQYLLYFGAFLRDVGINASVEIKEETDRVLFSVTPNDSHEALDRIRQVLDLYLGLPTTTFETTDEKEYRLEAQRLSANIMHYKGQLMLAQAMIEQKDATIGLLKERLVLQGEMSEGRLLPEPAKQKEADKEELLGGAIEIKKYEGKGFAVNLPKLYRDVRRYLKGDGEK